VDVTSRGTGRDGSSPPAGRASVVGCLIVYLLLGIALYSRTLGSFFLSDDFPVLQGICERGPLAHWIGHEAAFLRPLVTLSHFLELAVYGLRPVGFHLTNTVLHSLGAFAVFLLTSSVARVSAGPRVVGRGIAFATGLLFLALGTHPEPVSWISGRADLLAGLLSLVSVLLYVRHLDRDERRPRLALGLSLAFYAAALLSKESAGAVLPIVIVLGLFLAGRRRSRPRSIVPHIAVSIGYVAVRYLLLGKLVGGYGGGVHTGLSGEALAKLLVYFPSRTLIPALGTVDVGGSPVPLNLLALAAVVVALVALSLRRRCCRLTRTELILAAASMLALLPTVGLSVSAWDSQGTRFLYFPSALFAVTLVVALVRVLGNRRAAVVAAVLVIASGVWSWRVNENWREAGSIARSVVSDMRRAGASGRLVVLNVPDSVRGAYVFRNGIGDAAAMFCEGRASGDVAAISCHPVSGEAEEFPLGEEPGGRFLIRVPEGRSVSFCPPFRKEGTAGELAEFEIAPEGIRFRLLDADARGARSYFSYSEGGLRAVPPPIGGDSGDATATEGM